MRLLQKLLCLLPHRTCLTHGEGNIRFNIDLVDAPARPLRRLAHHRDLPLDGSSVCSLSYHCFHLVLTFCSKFSHFNSEGVSWIFKLSKEPAVSEMKRGPINANASKG